MPDEPLTGSLVTNSGGAEAPPINNHPQPSSSSSTAVRGTLATLWATSGPPPPLPPPTPPMQRTSSTSSAAGPSPQPARKRKKNDAPLPSQGRLTFSANGSVGVAAPPPPSPPPPVVEKKRKPRGKAAAAKEAAGTSSPKKRGRDGTVPNAPTTPPATASQLLPMSPDSPDSPDSLDIIEVSSSVVSVPGTRRAAAEDDDDIVVTGGTVPKRARPAPAKKVDSRPTHSFFSRARGPEAASGDSAAEASASPALLTAPPSAAASFKASPATSAAPSGTSTPKVVHSFFNLAPRAEPGKLKNGWGCCKEGEEPFAPWPGREWPAHVDAPGDIVEHVTETTFPLRQLQPPPSRSAVVDYASERVGINRGATPPPAQPPSGTFVSAPPFLLAHPAIAAVATTPLDTRESWCDAHRPRTASAVLGNEVEATYLRDWLSALSVGSGAHDGHGPARRVIRRVPLRKAVDPDKAWIVDDVGWFGDPVTEDVVDDFCDAPELPEPVDEPVLPLGVRPESYPPIGMWIGNAILLKGPSGSGKTTAVHAAAHELGWDVFEVYPGIGRRTGANLLSLVGDVGRNHMVTDKKDKKEGADAKKSARAEAPKSFFGKAASKVKSQKVKLPPSQGSAQDPIELDDESQGTATEAPSCEPEQEAEPVQEPAAAKTKQSLILIDEADILFDEESTFWSAVVALIAESRRPVVITCNDQTLIPLDQVPLHTTLHFFPPPSYLAQPYLAAIAAHHGVHADVVDLYEQCKQPPLDLVEQPLPPNGNEPAARFDLRAAVTQMQLDRSKTASRCDVPPTLQPDDITSLGGLQLADLARRMEAASLADAFVAPRPWARMEVADIDRLTPCSDDQDVPGLLLKPDVQDLYPALAYCAHAKAADMSGTLLQLAGGALPPLGSLHLAQTAYVRSVLPVLTDVVPLSQRLLPDGSCFLETIPVVKSIVLADDAMEAAHNAAIAAGQNPLNRRGRVVRITSFMAGRAYERWLAWLTVEQLEGARRMGLV